MVSVGATAGPNPPSSLGETFVLIVEDDPQVLEATSYMVEAAFGCKVLSASSCAEALALIDRGERVDLIFSEALLTDTDGLTMGRLARERLPDVPIVLQTKWDDDVAAIIERGYMPLSNPYTVQRLGAIFTELLCKTSRSDSGGGETTAQVIRPSNPGHPQKLEIAVDDLRP